jgi:hypothetical protein
MIEISDASAAEGRPTIEVGLTTYNSEAYLPALLDSLFAQTRQEFTLLIGDDGSSDRTGTIIDSYSKLYPGRIVQLPAVGERLGIIGNFDRVLAHADADYVFLCDHDDVWLPDKIERSLEAMEALAAGHPPGTPLLIHTDLIVAGSELEILSESFFDYAGVDPRRNDPVQILLANVVTGCTTVINRPLRLQARPIPSEALMYDHWLALVAVTTGAIAFVEEPTVLYRQHEGNAIGANPPRTRTLLLRDRDQPGAGTGPEALFPAGRRPPRAVRRPDDASSPGRGRDFGEALGRAAAEPLRVASTLRPRARGLGAQHRPVRRRHPGTAGNSPLGRRSVRAEIFGDGPVQASRVKVSRGGRPP